MNIGRSPFLLAVSLFGFILGSLYIGSQTPQATAPRQYQHQSVRQTPPISTSQEQSASPTIEQEQATMQDGPMLSESGLAAGTAESMLAEPTTAVNDAPLSVMRTGLSLNREPELPYDPAFEAFVKAVSGGPAELPAGVYVADVLALTIVQQPANDSTHVTPQEGQVSQFQSAARQGVTGLLAHNYLSGILYYNLELGDEVRIVYGDGSFNRYRVEIIEDFQRLDFNRLNGDFVDQATGAQLSSSVVFARFYSGGDRVTFQTCLERDGRSNWGLHFVVATPIP